MRPENSKPLVAGLAPLASLGTFQKSPYNKTPLLLPAQEVPRVLGPLFADLGWILHSKESIRIKKSL